MQQNWQIDNKNKFRKRVKRLNIMKKQLYFRRIVSCSQTLTSSLGCALFYSVLGD